MNSAENPLVIKFSEEKDGPEIVEFLKKNAAHTPNVFVRNEDLLLAQAAAGRITTVRQSGELVSMSSIYILGHKVGDPPPPPSINCIRHGNGVVEEGVVAELGSVIKKLAQNEGDPKGYGRLVHFCLNPLLALRFDMPVDLLVAEVFHSNPETKAFILDGRKARESDSSGTTRYEQGSPVYFPQITNPHPDMLKACGATSPDPKVLDYGRDFYRIPVSCVVPIAQTFKEILDRGFIEDLRPRGELAHNPDMKIFVDLSQLSFKGANGKGSRISLRQLTDFILAPEHKTELGNARSYEAWRNASRYVDLNIGRTMQRNASVQGVSNAVVTTAPLHPSGIATHPTPLIAATA